jgi:hypothetical protein
MTLVRHIQFVVWFFFEERAYNHMLRLARWEEQFKYEQESDWFE